MRPVTLALALALALIPIACGGKTPPPDEPDVTVPDKKPAPPDACGETATLLDDSARLAADAALDAEATEKARAEYVALVTEACRSHGWPAVVIDCVRNAEGGRDEAAVCLDQLPGNARKALTTLLANWRRDHSAVADQRKAAPVSCDNVIGDIKLWVTPDPDGGPVPLVAERIYRIDLERACTAEGWPTQARSCIASAGTEAALAKCRAKLADPAALEAAQSRAAARLDAATELIATPRLIECAKVADKYYAEDTWKDLALAPRLVGRARGKVFAAGRKRMAAACMTEAWEPLARACVVSAAAAADLRGCLDGRDGPDPRWGFPPAGAVVTTGIRECEAYFAEREKRGLACAGDAEAVERVKTGILGDRYALVTAPDGRDVVGFCTAEHDKLKSSDPACAR